MTKVENKCVFPDSNLTPDKYQLCTNDAIPFEVEGYGKIAVCKEKDLKAEEMQGGLCLVESITSHGVKALELGICCGKCKRKVYFRPLD